MPLFGGWRQGFSGSSRAMLLGDIRMSGATLHGLQLLLALRSTMPCLTAHRARSPLHRM